MAISNVKGRGSKGLGFKGGLSQGNTETSLHSNIGIQSAQVGSTSDLTFKERIASNSSQTQAMAEGSINILLPNGELNETVLSMLQDKIHKTGELLLVKPGYDTVIEYKNSVQTLLKSIVPYLHKKESTISPKRINGEVRQRKFTLVHHVNQKLDVILKIVLSAQTDQMQLMKRLDEIRGLIVDILQ